MRIDRSFKHYTDGRWIYLTFICKIFYLLRLDTKPHAWEMHMHGAGTFVAAAQDQLFAPGKQQFARDRVGAVVGGQIVSPL